MLDAIYRLSFSAGKQKKRMDAASTSVIYRRTNTGEAIVTRLKIKCRLRNFADEFFDSIPIHFRGNQLVRCRPFLTLELALFGPCVCSQQRHMNRSVQGFDGASLRWLGTRISDNPVLWCESRPNTTVGVLVVPLFKRLLMSVWNCSYTDISLLCDAFGPVS